MPRPRILLGGAPEDSGAFSTLEQLNALLAVLRQHNVTSIDTAALYPSASSGRSESPLGEARAAGLLTDFAIDTKIGNKDMGFDTSNGKSHKFMYDKPSMHDAVKMLAWECENGEGTVKGVDEGDATITPLGEASLRWLYYHSALNEYDGMILRVHSVGMIVANGKAIGRGPLPEGLVVAFDTVRDMVKKDAPIF
ncbi:MAG: hypothetical protein Q9157_002092 [Trypethelium eluteriae]